MKIGLCDGQYRRGASLLAPDVAAALGWQTRHRLLRRIVPSWRFRGGAPADGHEGLPRLEPGLVPAGQTFDGDGSVGLKVIGAGLGRTGTASLKVALEQLGVGRCHHMGEVLADPEQIPLWIEAADGAPNWDRLLGAFSASVDYPSCSFWRELSEAYPDAKVILSTRDAASWFESVNATIMAPHFNDFIAPTPWGRMVRRTIWDTLDGRMGDRAFMIDYFERRSDEIQRTLPSDRLLVFQAREGWAPLCDFLGVPVPEMEFPRINTREETKRLLAGLMTGGEDGPDEETMAGAADELFG